MIEKAERKTYSGMLKELPRDKKQIEIDAYYDIHEYDAIKLGMVPREMEDKWFIFSEDDEVFFHRSWTGHCIYKIKFSKHGNGYKICEAWVNRDFSEYLEVNDVKDAELLKFLIDRLLLCKPVLLPKAVSNHEVIKRYSFIGRASGNREDEGR